jgi:hypothetical protein
MTQAALDAIALLTSYRADEDQGHADAAALFSDRIRAATTAAEFQEVGRDMNAVLAALVLFCLHALEQWDAHDPDVDVSEWLRATALTFSQDE